LHGEGKVFGHILYDFDGNNGFGYDSLFYCDELQKSFGKATDEEKNAVSHRRRAVDDLINKLKIYSDFFTV
ncbi:MAG: non-canonical purine NTP pyrophosphatase, partial [Sphingobacteriia bacterium]|nr:non-canonical purine NTP pyrophosphatase [Sphingobacteriia bacterium]